MLYLGGLTAHSHLLIPRHYMDSRTSFFLLDVAHWHCLVISVFFTPACCYSAVVLELEVREFGQAWSWRITVWVCVRACVYMHIIIKPLGQGVQHLWVSNVHTQVQYPLKGTPECMFCNSTSNVHFHLPSSEWAESTDHTQDWMVSSTSVQAALPFLLWSGRTGIFTLSQAPVFYMVPNQCFKCAWPTIFVRFMVGAG